VVFFASLALVSTGFLVEVVVAGFYYLVS